jgi:phage terminase small subunit
MAGSWRSGGKPKPTVLKIIEGSRIRGLQQEPRPKPGAPICPAEIQADPQALEHWRRLVSHLEPLGLLSTVHGDVLATLAHSLADYQRVRVQLQTMGHQPLVVDETRDSKTGQIVVKRRIRENPLIRRSERLALLVTRLLGEFGLSPATQPRVQAASPPTPDPFEIFLAGKRPH